MPVASPNRVLCASVEITVSPEPAPALGSLGCLCGSPSSNCDMCASGGRGRWGQVLARGDVDPPAAGGPALGPGGVRVAVVVGPHERGPSVEEWAAGQQAQRGRVWMCVSMDPSLLTPNPGHRWGARALLRLRLGPEATAARRTSLSRLQGADVARGTRPGYRSLPGLATADGAATRRGPVRERLPLPAV